ncbi:integrase [Parabacteroides sp. PF5-5]|uniref:site-specific integrase n=1 Tax=unclassified Parabacteroides TaxID=2649774 RepID=UPI002473F2C6|nr:MULTISPECIES: site-specific integrase [unclassified Parabacteroides]MDH6304278.1 integrase [Parabacteroides sp. PH5-39]MDH6315007.1 integrase [Parabacteroides sp. PF5-13]MDH6318667.1 integrase [Parabacteroides sp. PH5-13]MDH6322397.1 integrase [Parabacteroides sp. PH5-8]MDH6326468.1 integrase [Parabacteroides sp. PH5-41]
MVNILCYKSKTLANGEHPLMVRVCKDGKKKYSSLGISINPQYWDFKKGKLKRNCPDRDNIQSLINEKLKEYSAQIIELKSVQKDFTASSLINKVNKPILPKTVKGVFDNEIKRLNDENRLNYALSYKQLMNSLIDFNGNLDIYFSDIDSTWLKNYETFLRKKDLGDNTIGIRFRTLRAIFNMAIQTNIVKPEYYPFNSYNVSKLSKETAKRAVCKADIEAITNYQTSHAYTVFAIDLFMFSYLQGGINFVDIAYLTKDNLIDGRLVYTRQKTRKLIKLPLQPKAIELIEQYKQSGSPYLFPILSPFHKTGQQKANRVHKVITKVNKYLKAVGEELNLPINLTTYVARHSQATQLLRSGAPTAIISQIMGHSSEKVTQIYLDSFENSQIDEAMKNLL